MTHEERIHSMRSGRQGKILRRDSEVPSSKNKTNIAFTGLKPILLLPYTGLLEVMIYLLLEEMF